MVETQTLDIPKFRCDRDFGEELEARFIELHKKITKVHTDNSELPDQKDQDQPDLKIFSHSSYFTG